MTYQLGAPGKTENSPVCQLGAPGKTENSVIIASPTHDAPGFLDLMAADFFSFCTELLKPGKTEKSPVYQLRAPGKTEK